MKKSAILKLFSLVTFAAAGAFAIANVKSVKKAESVKAETVAANTRVYLNVDAYDWNTAGALFDMYFKSGGSDVCNARGTLASIKGSSDNIYVFTPTASYDTIWVQRTNPSGGSWGGFDIAGSTSGNVIKLSSYSSGYYDDANYNVYYETLTSSSGGSAVMYLKGDSTKSGNGYYYNHNGLTLVATPSSGYHFVKWERDGVEASTSATYTVDSIGGDHAWRAVFAEDSLPEYTVSFYLEDKSTLYDSVVVYQGSTAACSKADPTKAQSGKEVYTFAGWVNNDGTPATLSNVQSNFSVYASFSTGYAAGRYVVGIGGEWNVAHGELMAYDSVKTEYSVTVTLSYGDEVKIVYYDGTDIQWNKDTDVYEKLVPSAEAYHYFGRGDGDDYNGHNMKCYARGSYTFYFTDGNYEGTYKSSVAHNGALNAEHLAAQLMGAGDTEGQCITLFSGMKEIFLGLSDGEKAIFQGYENSSEAQFKNAYLRYVAWAAHLHQKPWEEGAVAGSPYVVGGTDSNNLIIIVSIVSLISASTLVGLIVIKRRRGIAK